MPRVKARRVARLSVAACVSVATMLRADELKRPLTDLSLAELSTMKVTSVSRRAESLADAPASIFVITADDIRRSGARSLPEALRLAPNLVVARADAAQYAISARGFNNTIANKLLVLVDGRTIYTPLFSGVFWDQQDVLLEDVERIEVISGPGATLWGTNAVNGVINVSTRPARDTPGPLISAAAGTGELSAALRWGFSLGDRGHVRAYGRAVEQDNTVTEAGGAIADGRRWRQGGFRADWGEPAAGLRMQGDVYDGRADDRGSVRGFELGRVELSGWNLLGEWRRPLTERADLQLRASYDHYERKEAVLFQPRASLVDFEVKHGRRIRHHSLQAGMGYRHGEDEVADGLLVGFRPSSRSLSWINVFVQDEVRLGAKVALTAGLKLERNDYTGWEYLPGARLAWKTSPSHLVWGAVSRAVRAPARLDREVISPFGGFLGGPSFESEVATVVEAGYRGRPAARLSGSATIFVQRWDNLRSGTAAPILIENRIEGPVYGSEVWMSWQPARAWRLSAGVLLLRKSLRLDPGSTDPVGVDNPQLANDPGHQWALRSSQSVGGDHELDVWLRHTGALRTPVVPPHTALDLRYGWRMGSGLELYAQGQNVIGDRHPEFGGGPARSVYERRLLAGFRWAP